MAASPPGSKPLKSGLLKPDASGIFGLCHCGLEKQKEASSRPLSGQATGKVEDEHPQNNFAEPITRLGIAPML